MPESVLLEKILSGHKLTAEQWCVLVRERSDLVRYSMDRVRLTPLGDFKFVASELGGGVMLSVNDLNPREVNDCRGADLKTEGIFLHVARRQAPSAGSEVHCLVGLSRHGTWIDVVAVEGDCRRNNFDRFLTSVRIGVCPPDEIVARYRLDCRGLLAFLTDQYEGWVRKKREQLDRMLKIQAVINRDDLILDALCAEPKK